MYRTVDEIEEDTHEVMSLYTAVKETDEGETVIHENVENVPRDGDDGRPPSDVEYLLVSSVED